MFSPKPLLALIFASTLFLSGCLTAEIDQTLYRDGTFDLHYQLTLPADQAAAVDQLVINNQLVTPAIRSKFSFINNRRVVNDARSLTLSFEGLTPEEASNLFAPLPVDADSNTFDFNDLEYFTSGNFKYEKQTALPNYKYVWELQLSPEDLPSFTPPASNTGPLEVEATDYVRDDLNLFTEEEEIAIATGIADMLTAHQVEFIVATRPETTETLATEATALINAFEFAYSDVKYALLLIKPAGEDGSRVCDFSHNLLDNSALTTFTADIAAACATPENNPAAVATGAISSLSTYFTSSPPETTRPPELTINVETFANITSTNGQKSDDQRVSFTINPDRGGTYSIEIQESIWANWLAATFDVDTSQANLFLIIAVGIVLAIIVLIILLILRSRRRTMPATPKGETKAEPKTKAPEKSMINDSPTEETERKPIEITEAEESNKPDKHPTHTMELDSGTLVTMHSDRANAKKRTPKPTPPVKAEPAQPRPTLAFGSPTKTEQKPAQPAMGFGFTAEAEQKRAPIHQAERKQTKPTVGLAPMHQKPKPIVTKVKPDLMQSTLKVTTSSPAESKETTFAHPRGHAPGQKTHTLSFGSQTTAGKQKDKQTSPFAKIMSQKTSLERKPNIAPTPPPKPLPLELTDYITKARSSNMTDPQIEAALLGVGWPKALVTRGLIETR